jgi:hypothetical protein
VSNDLSSGWKLEKSQNPEEWMLYGLPANCIFAWEREVRPLKIMLSLVMDVLEEQPKWT